MADLFHHLKNLLETDIQHSTALLALLEQEQQSLIDRDFKLLPQIAGDKHQLSSKIEESNTKKLAILAPFTGTSDDPATPTDSINNLLSDDEAATIKSLNQQLEQRLEECKRLNLVNGQVIVENQKNHTELVKIISGDQRIEQVYNATGKVVEDPDNQPFRDKV